MNEKAESPYVKLAWVLFFSIWMAYLESAIVVYLRQLYYPDGFSFPIKHILQPIAVIELFREVATIFMLLTISFLTGKNGWARLAYFMFSFGAWDIWYYIWLKIFINWPESLLTWDLLFLIPVPWSGPVIAPVIVSVSLIVVAIIVLNLEHRGINFWLTKGEKSLLVCAALLIFLSFLWQALTILKLEVPTAYPWEFLLIGEVIGIVILIHAIRRLRANQLSLES